MRRWVFAVTAVLVMILALSASAPILAQDDEPWDPEDKGTTIEKILAWPLSFPMRMVEKLGEAGGFQTLDKLVFLNGVSDEDRQNLPWGSKKEADTVYQWYWILAIVTAPFYALAIIAAALKLIQAGATGNPKDREEAMDDLQRWFFVVLVVGIIPLLIKGLMLVTGTLIDAISGGFDAVAADRGIADWGQVSLTQMNFATGSVLGTVILKVFFALMWFYLNIMYIVRKICISVMLCFSPLAVLIWAVNKKTTAIPIWLGELASNAFMPVAHALVLCTILAICDVKDTENTWLTILISLYTLIPMAEAIRNSMMSLIARFGGMSETGATAGAMGAVLGLGSLVGLGRAVKATVGGGSAPLPPSPTSPTPVARPVPPTGGPHTTTAGAQTAFSRSVSAPAGRPTAGAPSPACQFPVLSQAAGTAVKAGQAAGKAAGTFAKAIGGAVPGGEAVAETMGKTAGYIASGVAGGARLAWELGKDPQKTWGEIKGFASEKGQRAVEAVKTTAVDTFTVGKNVARGAAWVGKKTAAGIGKTVDAARMVPRYVSFTPRSRIR